MNFNIQGSFVLLPRRPEATALCGAARPPAGRRAPTAFLIGPLLVAASAWLSTPARAVRQNTPGADANAIVRQMVATYQHASTIQEVAAANFTDNKGAKLSQTYTIKYQAPNKLVIIAEDPQDGTLAAYANGGIVRFYSGARRMYSESAPAADLTGTVSVIEQLARKVTGAGFDQNLNPISFLLAQGMPRECRSFRFGGTKIVEGHKVNVVTGTADETWTQSVAPVIKGKSTLRELTLFIDTKTHLLLRAKAHLVWTLPAPPRGGKPGAAKEYGIVFEETHFGTTLDKPLRTEDFTFKPTADIVLRP